MYQRMIVGILGCSEVEARLVEAWMRLERGTLDGLTLETFAYEAEVGLACVRTDRVGSEALARSYGL